MDFKGRHIIVTGASSGMGEATARLIVAHGGRVSMIARRAERLSTLASELGDNANGFVADVGDKAALLSALDEALAAFGAPNGVFLNAGMGGGFAPIADYSDEQFDALLRVNMSSQFWAIRHLAPRMTGGAFLLTGSLASERGMANNIGYVASKHAVLGLARAAALELAPAGIRVNCLIPGFIDTPMMAEVPAAARAHLEGRVPIGTLGESADMAQTAAFLLSDAARYITGQAIGVDGGVLGTLSV